MDSRGLMKVTHMLSLASFGMDRPEVSHPLASLDSQVGGRERIWANPIPIFLHLELSRAGVRVLPGVHECCHDCMRLPCPSIMCPVPGKPSMQPVQAAQPSLGSSSAAHRA